MQTNQFIESPANDAAFHQAQSIPFSVTDADAILDQALAVLKQKERELQIEAALERIRTRAMAMHNSFELSDVLSVLFEQYDLLGICPVFSHLTLFDVKNNKFSYRTTGRNGQRVQAEQFIDINAIDAWKDAVENWKKGGPHTVDSHVYPPEILPQVFGLFHDILSVIPTKAKFYTGDFPDGLYITQGYCKFGYVGFGHHREATPEEKEFVKRVAVEFERLYQRFIDLQRAEVQIREAQVEASLERLRSAAMAMRSSTDIGNATGILFNELDKLSVPQLRSGFYIINENEKTMQVWRASTTSDGTVGQAAGSVSMTIHPMLDTAYDLWRQKETMFTYTLDGNDLLNYYRALSKHASQFTDNVKMESQNCTTFFFAEGGLFTFTREKLDAETIAVLKKFASVFGLTYRRYLDLQIAEDQAREVRKQASLDRVRAEIASMRKTSDLERITPLIWNELKTLGVPFIRCGVFIMDEKQQVVHTYLSTPEGKAVASFDLPYNSPGNICDIVLHWQKNQPFHEYWDEEAYTEFAEQLVQQGVISSSEQYLSALPKGGFYLQFIPFLQGMLYVGDTAPLSEEGIRLMQALANAFSTAYARYEDFSKLEEAKKQVDKSLHDLKQAQQQLIQAEKMASLGELTAGIAHEIQNPLNFINNFSVLNVELITEMKEEISKGNFEEVKNIAENLKKNEEKIGHHGRRADAIVKGMLQHSRKSDEVKELIKINELANEFLYLSYQGQRTKNNSFHAVIEKNFDETIGQVAVIPQDIGRVFLNLYNNAFYALSEKKKQLNGSFEPKLSVSTKKEKNSIRIAIRDNGNGIAQANVEKIFQPFFTTKPAGEGTGLGLSLSYEIVTKSHGGSLLVRSKEGEGSEFVVQLPVA